MPPCALRRRRSSRRAGPGRTRAGRARDRLRARPRDRPAQAVAALQRRAVGLQEDFRRRRPARQPRLRARQRVGEIVLDRETVAREPDRRRDQLRERELARAVFLVRERKPRDRAGHADAERRVARLARIGLALLVEEHVARHRGRRGLAVVDRDRLVAAREMHQHEAAAADIAGLRMRDGEREADRDRGVDRVAACLQDLDADARGVLLLRRHHAVARDAREGSAPGW